MFRQITICISLLSWLPVFGQYTYFSQLTGAVGDIEAQRVTNIEVVSDGYIVWGLSVPGDSVLHFVRRYDFDGNEILTKYLHFSDFLYAGIVTSFQFNSFTNEFMMLQGAETSNGVQGRFLAFNTDLDLVTDLYYDLYPPYTYFFGFLIESNGYIVIGEQGPDMNSEGTFIAKLDFEGNVIWNEILQPEVYQHIYRNYGLLRRTNGYLIFGISRQDQTSGILTFTDLDGQTTQTILSNDPAMPRSNGMRATRLIDGQIMVSQSFGYEWVEEIGNPHLFWNKLRISTLDTLTFETYNAVEHFTNYEYFWGGPNDFIATPDGGAIFLGSNLGWWFDSDSWMLKVDANGNQEWYSDINYEICNDCQNILYDIELAPDGGYIAAGYFINSAVDPRSSTWLVKVDACGDLEWQGCAPLNVPERKGQSFSIYPNPSAGRFIVETANQSRVQSYRVYDLSGRLLAQEKLDAAAGSFTMDVNVPSGFYTLQVVLDDGTMEAYKIQVVR